MLLFHVALIFGFALGIQAVGIRLGIRKGWLDRPSETKTHSRAVPYTGGVGIFLTILFGAGIAAMVPNGPLSLGLSSEFLTLFPLALLALVAVGFIDDRYQISPWARIVVQVFSTTLTLFIPEVRSLLHGWSAVFGMLVWPLYFMFVTGVTNAFNLIDGRDGLAGSTFLFTSMTLLALSLFLGTAGGVAPILGISAIAVSGFLLFNAAPAKVFMGDSGSAPLGFLLAVCSILVCGERTVMKDFFVPLLLLGYPILNMGWATIGRILRRSSPMMNDRSQLHDRFGLIFSRSKNTYGYLMTLHLIFQVSALSLFLSDGGLEPYLIIGSSILLVFNVVQIAAYALPQSSEQLVSHDATNENNVIPIRSSVLSPPQLENETAAHAERTKRESA